MHLHALNEPMVAHENQDPMLAMTVAMMAAVVVAVGAVAVVVAVVVAVAVVAEHDQVAMTASGVRFLTSVETLERLLPVTAQC